MCNPHLSRASTVTTSQEFQERCGRGGLVASLSTLAWGWCDRIGTLVVYGVHITSYNNWNPRFSILVVPLIFVELLWVLYG